LAVAVVVAATAVQVLVLLVAVDRVLVLLVKETMVELHNQHLPYPQQAVAVAVKVALVGMLLVMQLGVLVVLVQLGKELHTQVVVTAMLTALVAVVRNLQTQVGVAMLAVEALGVQVLLALSIQTANQM
jgi:ABC-type amino acid transport system permease subunit